MKLNKQILLSVGAITGMCCAVGTAIYATPKAKELADKYKDDKVEAAKRVAPLYIPTLLSFIAASGCIFAKDYISRKELLALTASTATTPASAALSLTGIPSFSKVSSSLGSISFGRSESFFGAA